VTELNIATYRNILTTEASPLTGRALRQGTINYKLGVICQFYRFAHKKGRLNAVPFEPELSRIPYHAREDFNVHGFTGKGQKHRAVLLPLRLLRSIDYAVERLAYLQDIGAPDPLKVLQMELGHAHLATTERYLHLTERMRSEVMETHNSFVDRLLEG